MAQTILARVITMPLYVVTKNETPIHATFREDEARQLFQMTIHSGQYNQVAVLVVPAWQNMHVLFEAAQQNDQLR